LRELLKLDWDGIDIAEFSITGGVGNVLEGRRGPRISWDLIGPLSRACFVVGLLAQAN